VRHELIDGDLGPLRPTRRGTLLEIRFVPVQRGEVLAAIDV
jgi:hypothetical protein